MIEAWRVDLKTCTKCGGEYPVTAEYFGRDHRNKNGLRSWCKECHRRNSRQRREKNPEKVREHARRYYKQNRERVLEYTRQYQKRNPEKMRELDRRYREQPGHRLHRSISTVIGSSLKSGKNGRSWESLVGYTCEDLMAHLEAQFTKGMTWDNYGKWHIDHIRPVSDFGFDSPDDPEFKECWSLWNLQPMWGKDNLAKAAKCEAPPLPLGN